MLLRKPKFIAWQFCAVGLWLLSSLHGECFCNVAPRGPTPVKPAEVRHLSSRCVPRGEAVCAVGPAVSANRSQPSTNPRDDQTDFDYYGYRYYNACTGRWLSRDPIEESGGANLYTFARNTSPNTIDVLGKVARGACLLMNCINPCQQWRQKLEAKDRYVDAGGIVCCGGIKFVCTWAADGEKNERAKKILEKCIGDHERRHLLRSRCPDCDCGVGPVNDRDMGELCQEELDAHSATKACYEAALAECGTDPDCIKKIKDQVTAEDIKISYYRGECNRRKK